MQQLRSTFHTPLCIALLTLHCLLPAPGAAEPPATYAEAIKRLEPMSTGGLDDGLANVLRNYYARSFTDFRTWNELESIRLDGTLHLPQGVVRFTAFKKKPNYCKAVLFAPNGGRIVLAYDGADAWQLNTLEPDAKPTAMSEGDALNFIRDATTGGHLLYPLLEGKTITLEGISDVDGRRAYLLRIELPDGQLIYSFLDLKTFDEIRQVATNNLTGEEEITSHSNFRRIDGIRVPFTSALTADGMRIYQIRLDRVQANLGVMPWMFSRPSGAYIPSGQKEDMRPELSEEAEDNAREPEGDPQSISFLPDIWAPSPFIDPDSLSPEEIKRLSKQIELPPSE